MYGASCPIPLQHAKKIILGHGSGGKMSLDLISQVFLPRFDNPSLYEGNDAAVVDIMGESSPGKLVVSTDSHVVDPLFFNGGDIGRLAVCGTVNDVSMMGATPLYLTAGFILEEGLEMPILEAIISSMKDAAEEAGIQIIAGDTKVVQKGKADGMYINTAGIGVIRPGVNIKGSNAQVGDVVLLSGTIGDHGIAVLDARGDLGFVSDVVSDVAPLNHMIQDSLSESNAIHVMRDPTRGGLATTLNEIARQSQVGIFLDESQIPINPSVQSACELLGFDPLYIANEGKVVFILTKEAAPIVLNILRKSKFGKEACLIGEIKPDPKGRVLLRTTLGSTRIIDIPSGEILPRIC